MVVRCVTVAVVVAGCYRPTLERSCSVSCGERGECPSGLACNEDALCSVGGAACELPPVDATSAPPDGATSVSCEPFTSTPTMLLVGNSYVTYPAATAYWMDGNTVVERPGASPESITKSAVDPKLTPDGRQIFAADTSRSVLLQWTFDGVRWGMPSVVTTNRDGVVPGTVTATMPRLMYVASDGVLAVGTDTGGGTFMFASFDQFGFHAIRHPSIDPSGNRLVFVGEPTAGADTAIYIMTRVDANTWTTPAVLFDYSEAEAHPFVDSACQRLYFSAGMNQYEVAR